MKQKTPKKKKSASSETEGEIKQPQEESTASPSAASPTKRPPTVPPPVPKPSGMSRVSMPPPIPQRASRPMQVPSSTPESHPAPVPVRSSVPSSIHASAPPASSSTADVEDDPALFQVKEEPPLPATERASIRPEVGRSAPFKSMPAPAAIEEPAVVRKSIKPPAPPVSKPFPARRTVEPIAPGSSAPPVPKVPRDWGIPIDFTATALPDTGEISLPPAEERKPQRPSPAVISDIARRIAAVKSTSGVVGPIGDTAERARAVIAACETEISPTADKKRAARLHCEIAQCHELYLNDEGKALQHYQKSIDLAPEYLPAIRGARRLLTAQKNYLAVLKLLDSEIDLEGDAKYKALLHCVKGRILEDCLHQQTKARQCYQKADELNPGNPEIIEALKQVEQKAKNWPGLAVLLEQAADAITEDSKYRSAVIAERARLLDTRIKNPAAAAETYVSALRMNPEAQGVTAPLKRLLYNQSRWQDLVELWERDIAASADEEMRASGLLHISHLYANRIGDRAKAVETLERAYKIAPSNLLVLETLVAHYEIINSPERLIDALKRLAAAVPPDHRRVALLHRIAELFEKQMGDAAQAVAWYEEALRISPTYVPALRAVTGLYELLGRWDSLIAMYLTEASNTDESARRADAHVRAAEIFEYRLNRSQDAAVHHALALALVPELESSFKALARLYAQARQYKPLIELYEAAVDRSKEEDSAFTYLFKIGSIYEDALGRPDLAVDVYRRIQKRSNKHLGAIHAIQRTAEAAGRFEDLLEALKMEAEIVKEPKRRVELLQAAAETANEKLRDTETAITWYKKVLDADPAYPRALAGIGRLYHSLERWPDLLDIYSRELALAETNESKVALLTKMAELSANPIGNDDAAVKYYRKAVDLDPSNMLLLHALSSRLERKGDFDTLVEVTQAEIKNMSDPEDRARAAVRMAEIHELQRKDLVRAAAAYRQALDEVSSYRPAMDGLTRVNAALGHWSDLADQLIKEAELAENPSTAVEALLQAGIILSDHLGDIKRAVTILEGVLAKDSTNTPALMALAPLLRESGAWQKLIEVHVRLSNELSDARERASVLKELARLTEAYGAFEDLRRALITVMGIDPRDPTVLTQLEQIAATKKDWSLLAEVDVHWTSATPVPDIAAVYLARLGQAMETTAPEEAVEAYRGASAFDPDGLYALRGMAYLGEKTGSSDTQIQALKKEADWTKSGKNAADLLVQCADIQLRIQRNVKGAVADLAAALYRCPEHTEAAERVTSLLTSANQLEMLIEILSRAAEMTHDGARKGEYFGTVARLRSEGQNDIPGAIAALMRMLSTQPTHVSTMLHLADLYKRNRQWDEAAKILERAVKQHPQRKMLTDIHLELARIAESQLGNAAMALANVDALLQLDPGNVEALTLLCEAQFRSGNLDAAANASERLLKASSDPDSRAAALFCSARIRFKKNSKKSAAKLFREAVALAGPARMAGSEYLSMLGNEESWEEYLAALIEFQNLAASTPDNESALIDTIAEIARVQHEGQGQPAAAAAVIEQAMSALNNPPKLRYELAKHLAAAGQFSRSAAELRRLTAEDPMHPELWRLLSQVFYAEGKEAEAAIAAAPLVVIGDAAPREKRQAEQLSDHPSMAAPGSFSRSILIELTPRVSGTEAMTELMSALSDAFSKIYTPNFDPFGISQRDRLADDHLLRRLTNILATAFGIETESYDLYLSSTVSDVNVELTQPVSVIVPSRLNGAAQSSQIFALGRVFAYIARDQQSVIRLGPDEMRLAMAAVIQKFSISQGGYYDAESLDRALKRIFKAVSWRAKKGVDEAASLLASAPNLDINKCLVAMETAATRAAAILSSDLVAATAEIGRIEQDKSAQSSLVRDLLAFWVSETAFSLRRRAKLI